MTKKLAQTSPFWKPTNEGDSVEGAFLQFEITKPPKRKGEEEKKGLAMRLQPAGKVPVVLVPCGYTILTDLAPIRNTIKKGAKIKVVFEGAAKTKRGGNPVKKFVVWINGKEVPHQSPFGKPAEKDDLDAVFGSVVGS